MFVGGIGGGGGCLCVGVRVYVSESFFAEEFHADVAAEGTTYVDGFGAGVFTGGGFFLDGLCDDVQGVCECERVIHTGAMAGEIEEDGADVACFWGCMCV